MKDLKFCEIRKVSYEKLFSISNLDFRRFLDLWIEEKVFWSSSTSSSSDESLGSIIMSLGLVALSFFTVLVILNPPPTLIASGLDRETDLTTVSGRVFWLVTVNCKFVKRGFCGEAWKGAGFRWNFSGFVDSFDLRSPGVRFALI